VTPGHHVAAHVSGRNEPEDRWILGSVLRVTPDASMYVVEDIMEESDAMSHTPAKKERYALPYAAVIPLPRWSCAPGIPGTFYPSGSQVLALYPQTTCFYPAVVHEPPTHEHTNGYKMHFNDDDYPDGRRRYQDGRVNFVGPNPKPPPTQPRGPPPPPPPTHTHSAFVSHSHGAPESHTRAHTCTSCGYVAERQHIITQDEI
jgi:hypothetical protein